MGISNPMICDCIDDTDTGTSIFLVYDSIECRCLLAEELENHLNSVGGGTRFGTNIISWQELLPESQLKVRHVLRFTTR
jgi:hypothetical protein